LDPVVAMAERSEQPATSVEREDPAPLGDVLQQQEELPPLSQAIIPEREGPAAVTHVQEQQEEVPPLPQASIPIEGSSSSPSWMFSNVVASAPATTNSSVNDYDSIRTRYPPRRGSSSSAGGYYQQPPSVLGGFRSLLRCICFPIVVLTTLLAIFLFFLFVGVPFVLLLLGLLVTYYCCTSNPIPFRTLLRALVGVDDWNAGGFDGNTTNEPYNVTKEDIRKSIIRRLCLGPMEWKVVLAENNVGGDLSTLPRDHPGRVHWRNEASSEKILVFSAPLGSASASSMDEATHAVVEKEEANETSTSPSPSEMLQREESSPTRNTIPKYLQHHKEKEVDENEEKEEEKEDEQLPDKGKDDAVPKLSEELTAEPVHETAKAPSPLDGPPVLLDDNSSVRDRGAVCDICLLEFETGEAVAWSPNPACNHCYHEECITDWLLRKPTCPSCRQNFIVLPVVRQSGNDSSGVMDDSSSGEEAAEDDDANDDVESAIIRELANIDDSSTGESSAEIESWDGLQPPATANTEGDIEMGFTRAASLTPAENFENS